MLSAHPRTGTTTTKAAAEVSGRNVTIHVFDEYRKSVKDFVCDRELLLAKMKYFQTYLNQSNEHDEIDISVHCDVEVFEWLVKYMQQSETEWKPRIALENIASILVSSEFLQMDALVEECIRFITARMQAFLQLRVDFSCLSDATITKIADRCTAEELQKLHDPKDKILSKLQRKKLDAYVKTLHDMGRTIERCEHCEAIYLKEDEATLCCSRGKRQVGVHGELVAQHTSKSNWKVEDFLRDLVSDKNVTWSTAYWYVWASTNCFYCVVCKKRYAFLELRECAFHQGQVVGFGQDAKFSCCNARVFDSDDLVTSGCKSKEHIPMHDEVVVAAEKSADVITKLPGLWDLLRKCAQLARPSKPVIDNASSPSSSPPLKIATMHLMESEPQSQQHTPSATKRPPTAASAATSSSLAGALAGMGSSSNTTGGANELSSPGRRRQWRALQLQEKDRIRHQLLARRLVQMRKNLAT